MSEFDYGGYWRELDMKGEISLPNRSIVKVCDWTSELPDFMLDADTVFVDPPWNKGNMNTFYYKAERSPRSYDFLEFTKKLFSVLDAISPEFLFIEMGKQHLGLYLAECEKRYKYVTFYNSTYYHRASNKCYVIHATNNYKKRRYMQLEDMDEADIIAWLCANHEYQCIDDPCMGQGLVGLNACKNGKRFVGTELNHKRLAVLVAKIKDFLNECESPK